MRSISAWSGGDDAPQKASAIGAKPQFEQAVAAARLQIVLPLGHRARDQFDLALVEAELLIGCARLRLDRAVIRQEYPLRATFDDGRRNRRVRDIGQRLRGEHDRNILLAQHLQPFADAGGEQRIVEIDPGFVENEQAWACPSKRSSSRWNR